MPRIIFIVFLFTFSAFAQMNPFTTLLDSMTIYTQNSDRTFSFTNKAFSQYYSPTNRAASDGWHGWTVREQRIFNDYSAGFLNQPFNRERSLVEVMPHKIIRHYNIVTHETFFPADSVDLLFYRFELPYADTLQFQLIGFKGAAIPIPTSDGAFLPLDNVLEHSILRLSADSYLNSTKVSGDTITFFFEPATVLHIALSVENEENLSQNSQLTMYNDCLANRTQRILDVVRNAEIISNDVYYDRAFLWAVASLDALITKQQTTGIFAGLPWFNNYWGRDTFISLSGAALVTGNFKIAKDILLGFAKFQDANKKSNTYGRIPNRVTLQDAIYNTADGTPWFAYQCNNYYLYSGDEAFLREIYPVIKTAFDGAVERYVDAQGFLTNGPADTWMDAVGPEGPWSPRDNRANDIQALWYHQLLFTELIAKKNNDRGLEKEAAALRQKLTRNFAAYFVDAKENIIYDRLLPDGSGDFSIRPNTYFVLQTPELVPTVERRFSLFKTASEQILFPYGVLSLSQFDTERFHPYHVYPPFYVKDAAYHNGIIWTWNSGPAVSLLTEFGLQDSAFLLTRSLLHMILYQGACGTIPELTDAFPRDETGLIALSGTFSQAWSLAELIRNVYQDYLGAKPNAPEKTLFLSPRLPKAVKSIHFTQAIGNDRIGISYQEDANTFGVQLTGIAVQDLCTVQFRLITPYHQDIQFAVPMRRADHFSAAISWSPDNQITLLGTLNGVPWKGDVIIKPANDLPDSLRSEFSFAVPVFDPTWRSIQPPNYELLTNKQIKFKNVNSVSLITAVDSLSDEDLLYPTNPNFKDGIADIQDFSIREDDRNYYFTLRFRALSNPGWHPEYGFQLTIAAIAIQTENTGTLSLSPGLQTNTTLEPKRGYSRLVVVGGGIQIVDAAGSILAAYIPKSEDVQNPIGSAAERTISFSIPKRLLGKITPQSVITILTGIQDDAGGAGIGTFRNVEETPAEWSGGRKDKGTLHRVYDRLYLN